MSSTRSPSRLILRLPRSRNTFSVFDLTMASEEAANVAAAVAEEPNQTHADKEIMLQLFQVEAGLDPDEEVATSAVDLLEEAKVTKGWQLRKLWRK